ncbi:out at first protein [Schistocerca nitens]|uniref:out at first protein n=1 Tax=Schistocerca nitens TaxID=7011 RepID=UPI0021198611|nr:out at first protein [Schistocerca nitens]
MSLVERMITKFGASCAYGLGVLYLFNIIVVGDTQLLINVKNQGGDVLQETISANVSEDIVILEFQRSDGTLVTQLVDFRNDVQVLKALVLGEEERGQSQYQVMCFVRHFHKGDFISADAMAKLRQKNPGTVRTPEEDRGRENFTMDLIVDVNKSGAISHHIAAVCGEASDATYTREQDLQLWAARPGASLSALLASVSRSPPDGGSRAGPVPRCLETADPWHACTCNLELCVGWYPCGLKYCKGKDRAAALPGGGYRCGIKTCRKCSLLSYYVRHKQLCLWDE